MAEKWGWGPETVYTYRCPHGKRADDYCEQCAAIYKPSVDIVVRSRHLTPHETLSVRLPTALLDRVRIRLIDTRTGIVQYGSMKQTVIAALTLWLEEQK